MSRKAFITISGILDVPANQEHPDQYELTEQILVRYTDGGNFAMSTVLGVGTKVTLRKDRNSIIVEGRPFYMELSLDLQGVYNDVYRMYIVENSRSAMYEWLE